MANALFNSIRVNRLKRNAFDLSHENKLSLNMGDLVPILCREVIPGDTFKLSADILMRVAPLLAPVMHRVNVYTHFFFVPNRLVFDGWEPFITGGESGNDVTPFPLINIARTALAGDGSLADYLGLPSFKTSSVSADVSALPFRAYQMIYNEYYRDQNLEEPITFSTGSTVSSPDIVNLLMLRRRCWEKDYFTSALPWTQRGGDVHLPMNGDAPVFVDPNIGQPGMLPLHMYPTNSVKDGSVNYTFSSTEFPELGQLQGDNNNLLYFSANDLKTDLSNATASTINDLRRAVRLQEWLEKNARAGSRYIEQIFSHFGVKSSDSRLQRPEYLGGGKTPVAISEVLQTSASDSQPTPQGNMAGHGISVGSTHEFTRFFEEHGYIIGVMSVLPRSTYQQGIPRHFQKGDKFDYFWPEFAHLGEQEIKAQELYVDPDTYGSTFGYQSRYAEYKFANSEVHGDFRNTLSYWHFGRIFNGAPQLNKEFVHVEDITRPWPVTDLTQGDKFYCEIFFDEKAIRPIPKFGTPRL